MITDKGAMDRRRLILAAALALTPAVAAASGGAADKKKGGGESYLQLEGVSVSIVRRDGRRGVMTVECGLDVQNPALRERADASQPRLRAGYSAFMQTYASGLRSGGVPDADYIAREMQAVTDRVLGQRGAKLLLGTLLIN